jgi:Transposase, Mutator family
MHDDCNATTDQFRARAAGTTANRPSSPGPVRTKSSWKKIWSTNPPGAAQPRDQEAADVVGVLPNPEALARLAGAILAEHHDEWNVQDERRYLSEASTTELHPATPGGIVGPDDPQPLAHHGPHHEGTSSINLSTGRGHQRASSDRPNLGPDRPGTNRAASNRTFTIHTRNVSGCTSTRGPIAWATAQGMAAGMVRRLGVGAPRRRPGSSCKNRAPGQERCRRGRRP